MKQKINAFEKGQKAMSAMYGIGAYLNKASIEAELLHLIYFRVQNIRLV